MIDDLAAARDWLSRLVAFDTTSRGSNLALIAAVEAALAPLGFRLERVFDDTGGKANLIATIGPEVEGGVVLSGHTDVVPVDGQPWTSDPFTLTERDGRLYGRGAADMKGFLACCLALAPEMARSALARPIVMAFSYDEEVGCLGAPRLIARLIARGPRPALAIIGEPTGMKVVRAHKGIRTFDVAIIGREGHSSRPQEGVSAVMAALPFLALADEICRAAADDEAATMTVGRIAGGTAANILARRCDLLLDLRAPTEAIADALQARLEAVAGRVDAEIKARAPEGGVTVTRRSATPPLAPEPDNPAEALARALTGDNAPRAAAYAAEAGLFKRAGVPAVICGPGDIAQAHQPDEWIDPAELARCCAFLRGLLARYVVSA